MGEEDLSTAKVSVWWDIENCMVPNSVCPHDVARNISRALRRENFKGPISIAAYADTHRLPLEVQTAITSTGINLHHIPSGYKDASDKAIIVDMLFWALDNPPPAHILLISGDRDFSNAVHRLHMKNYNILVAGYLEESFSASLLCAASSVWHWTKLAKGENAEGSRPQKSDQTFNGVVQPTITNVCASSNAKDSIDCTSVKISDPPSSSLPLHSSKQQPAADRSKPDLSDNRIGFSMGITNLCAVSCPGNDPITIVDPKSQSALSTEALPYIPFRPIHIDDRPGIGFSFTHGLSEAPLVKGHVDSNMSLSVYLSCIGTTLKAMEKLKMEMLPPTEANIEACIRWSEESSIPFVLRKVLDKAVQLGDIVVLSAGIGIRLFTPKNTELWPCVDLNTPHQYTPEIWKAFHDLLHSNSGRLTLTQSQSLYHAALLLRKRGPKPVLHLPLGNIANLLHLAITVKGWFRESPRSSSPLVVGAHQLFNVNTSGLSIGSFQSNQSAMECAQGIGISLPEEKASRCDTANAAVLKKLRYWLTYVLCTERAEKGYDISSLRKDFEMECKAKLDPSELGFSKLVDLMKHLKDVARLDQSRPSQCLLFPANEDAVLILPRLRCWLREILSTEKGIKGFDISLVKRHFELDCNLKLDLQKLGFGKLQDLIALFTDILRLEYPRKSLCLLFPLTHMLVEGPTTLDKGVSCSQVGASAIKSNSGLKRVWTPLSSNPPPLPAEDVSS